MNNATYDSTPWFSLKGITTECKILDVYDGDTVTLAINLQGFGIVKLNCRLYGIDTEEMRGGTIESKVKAISARNYLIYLLTDIHIPDDHKYSRDELRNKLTKSIKPITCSFDIMDKYGRPLITLFDNNKTNINNKMIEENHANPYFGGTK